MDKTEISTFIFHHIYSSELVGLEGEVYGSVVWSSSGYDTGTGKTRLPLFAFSTMAINNRKSYYWLRDVASSSYFARVDTDGYAGCHYASLTDSYVRPRFVIGA